MSSQETTRQAESKLHSIEDKAINMKDSIEKNGRQAYDSAKSTVKGLANDASSAYETSKDVIAEKIKGFSPVIDDVENYVRENPIKSLLIGVGVYVVASRCFR